MGVLWVGIPQKCLKGTVKRKKAGPKWSNIERSSAT